MKLFSKKYGEKGNDLIIIHGLFGMSDNWNTLGKKFSKYCKVHLHDLRNNGRSPHSKAFNYDEMCDKIEKLIIADISPRRYNTEFAENLLRTLYKLPLENFEKREEIDDVLSKKYEDRGMRLFLMKNLYRNKQKEFEWRFNIDILLEKVNNIQEADFIEGVCNVPTHFIKGENSDYVTNEDELIISTHFSDVSIATIEGAGHWLHADNPQRFYSEVMGFCLI